MRLNGLYVRPALWRLVRIQIGYAFESFVWCWYWYWYHLVSFFLILNTVDEIALRQVAFKLRCFKSLWQQGGGLAQNLGFCMILNWDGQGWIRSSVLRSTLFFEVLEYLGMFEHLTTAHPPPWRLLPSLGLTNIGVAWVLEKYTCWPLDCDKITRKPWQLSVPGILYMNKIYYKYICLLGITRLNNSQTFTIVPALHNITQCCLLAPEA